MNSHTLTARLKEAAHEQGFELAGVCPAVTPRGVSQLAEWLAAGYAGEMDYIAQRQAAYAHPEHVLSDARSLLVLGMHYRTETPRLPSPGEGRISRYAWGHADYHDLIRARLHSLADLLRTLAPGAEARGVVDTAPLLEREFAALAGLGWIGKNTLLLNKQAGSYFFLAAVLTNLVLVYDEPNATDHCGTCRACLDACPTQAFVQPYVLDASRCISYLTIELRGQVAEPLRAGLGHWAFGCDVCQEVCPWNSKAPASEVTEFEPRAGANPMPLAELFFLNEAAFRARFRHTPLWRPKRRGLLRNAALVLGNKPHAAALPALVHGLNDEELLVRGACAWAIGQHGSAEGKAALLARQNVELNSEVRQEIAAALASSGPL